MKLTKTERWMLSNQYKILEALYPQEADSLAKTREALERGYEYHYEDDTPYIYDGNDVMTEVESIEVMNILDMVYKTLNAYDCLSTDEQATIPRQQLEFFGFDGNNETKQLGYVRHLHSRDLYSHISGGDNQNSHMPSLDIYRAQLRAFNESKDEFNLTIEDLKRVAGQRLTKNRL